MSSDLLRAAAWAWNWHCRIHQLQDNHPRSTHSLKNILCSRALQPLCFHPDPDPDYSWSPATACQSTVIFSFLFYLRATAITGCPASGLECIRMCLWCLYSTPSLVQPLEIVLTSQMLHRPNSTYSNRQVMRNWGRVYHPY